MPIYRIVCVSIRMRWKSQSVDDICDQELEWTGRLDSLGSDADSADIFHLPSPDKACRGE